MSIGLKRIDPVDALASPSAAQVAEVVSGRITIGAACEALRAAGWQSTIAGNRITVGNTVFVQFITGTSDTSDGLAARWLVYGNGDTTPRVSVVPTRQPASS